MVPAGLVESKCSHVRLWSSLSQGFHVVLMHEPMYPILHFRVLMKEFFISV